MTPETRRQYQADLARALYERGSYAKRAAEKRIESREHKRNRNWLAALKSDDWAAQYRQTRDKHNEDAKRIRRILLA
jgi:hypothetical protein